ncbi:cytochrome c-type biogenesis CcmF C-terminal domain-containing protein [Methanonatronarchaeum sp. AMET6-2]|uniref:cytochrome c-type biogenesis CcmF C-terminal domain-containing protein n=1 Tax=Methanonatronarchaeum sp. AMET6-2 TaxID=2933293 RepID=UPI0012299FA8|nr:cytochrome c-type biogenesis CcmF C-terminal domain-containing protein [Methanonatronarchaeum sp. AMET6-2]RZN61137.1 MAG: hypothetical protein EF811_05405 [Methanonatronarchaeia archaeon]UOY09805.1 hypothetical protein MU439_05975 [Methanonatronarchaeum sp. AMET6-2]
MKLGDINIQNLTTLTVILLGVTTIVIFMGVLLGLGPEYRSYYDHRVSPIILAILYLILACYLLRYINKKKTLLTILFLIIASAILYFTSPTENIYLDLSLPILISLLIILTIDLLKTLINRKTDRLQRTGTTLIHISFVLIVLGVIVTSTMGVYSEQTINENETWGFGDYEIEFTGYEETDRGYATYHHFNLQITDKDDRQTNTYIEGVEKGDSQSFRPAIHSTITEDLYISLTSAEKDQVTVTAETNPLILLMWIGSILFAVGLTIKLLQPTKHS